MKRTAVVLMQLVFVLSALALCQTVHGAEPLSLWVDATADDTGDGDYVYPTNSAFGEGGEADILSFSIEKENGSIIFVFHMRSLVDPWGVGNRLTMVAVAVDTEEGGDEELRRNANVLLEAPSEYQIFAAGETVAVIDAESEVVDIGATVSTDMEKGIIRISVPIAEIDGAASAWRFTPAAGLQDDYGAGGLGDFREVKSEPDEWWGGGGHDLAIDPNIYDIIVPDAKKVLGIFGRKKRSQEEILGAYNLERGAYAVLPALEIN